MATDKSFTRRQTGAALPPERIQTVAKQTVEKDEPQMESCPSPQHKNTCTAAPVYYEGATTCPTHYFVFLHPAHSCGV